MMSTLTPIDDSFVHPENLIESLRTLAADRPHDTALIVVSERDGEVAESIWSYRDFEHRVRALAAILQNRFNLGDRLLLLFDNDEHYAISLFACFYAGVIAVPAFPPESSRSQHLARLKTIAVDAAPSGVLTISAIQPMVATAAGHLGIADVIAVDLPEETSVAWQPWEPVPEQVAFLQYTSGSTSEPKGVMVTHGNLIANERAIRQAMSISSTDKLGVWSPLFHDMGLIGGLLQPFYSGIPCVLASPRFFLERPVRWLEMIAKHQITISGGPDFAYRLCLDRVKDSQAERLDLSSWRVAYTGAEPVRRDTMDAFVERYAQRGFSADAVYPCYGLAEATLLVTGGRRGSGMIVNQFERGALARRKVLPAGNGTSLVSCGDTSQEHVVQIVDAQTEMSLTEGSIGEIWISGPSVTAGYWNKPRETAATFVQKDGIRWLRTGDLGFIFDNGLYIAGRLKDMIIVRGHNLYPQDIERAVETEVEAVRKGRVAAFMVAPDGEETIGVAAEVSQGLQKLISPQALMDAISVAVNDQCGETPAVIVLLNPGALPKTSSGKLQRRACYNGWLERSLDAYATFENGRPVTQESTAEAALVTSDPIAQTLSTIWREVLSQNSAQLYDGEANFFASGGNSLRAVHLATNIAGHWAIRLTPRQIFENPQLKLQADLIRSLLQTEGGILRDIIPQLPAVQRALPQPLSAAQRRQWFLWQLDPAGTAYHIHGALRISGQLNADTLSDVLSDLIQRHESLRTVFHVGADGEPEQLIQSGLTTELRWLDLRDAADRETRASGIICELNECAFDLTRGPLIRALLIQLEDQTHLLALTLHHIIADGVSVQILLSELAGLYAMRTTGADTRQLRLPEIQSVDYALWQRQQSQPENYQRQLSYWRKQLDAESDTAQPMLVLPADFPRHAVARYQAAQYSFELTADLLVRLRQHAERSGTTVFMVLLAAFQILLNRQTGQRDIRIGVPAANRLRPELQGVVGVFVNTLVMRNVIISRHSLEQVLAQTCEAVLGAHENQELPFEVLVDALQPARSLSHSPLFQVLFNFLQEDFSALQLKNAWRVTTEPTTAGDAQFEFSAEFRERSDGHIRGNFIYAAELFEPRTIASLSSRYLAILEALVTRPDCAVGDIDLLIPEERAELDSWSRNPGSQDTEEIVHRRFERQVRMTPDATALRVGDQALSYTELNIRANQLAHHLIAAGVRPDMPVGIAMERSVDMVVGLLGIVKAGGAYVPIDPDYPGERLSYMLQDSGVSLLLTLSGQRSRLPETEGIEVLILDILDLKDWPSANPVVPLQSEHLVYVIYTSGSTGLPKGAANRHRGLCNRLSWGQQHQPLRNEDTVLQKTPFSFDISFWEFFWPLTTGATLLLAGPGEHRDPQQLAALIQRHDVTTIHFVPSMLQAFLAYRGAADCQGLKRIICSGEALPADLQMQVFRIFPGAALLNLYGPTEAAIEATWWDCREEGGTAVPIGRPLANLSTYVLDESLNQVPRGVVGELYLGGVCLARGYWRRAALTAERFVASPAGVAGDRLYRTGDLARWRADGQLEYLGRIDHQIKIRGFRIELGEIEAQLRAQPQVQEAVVVAEERPAGARLIAYVSVQEPSAVDVVQLKAALGEVLPDYMLPAVIVVMDQLPLNANGKVDRRALPAPTAVDGGPFEAPKGMLAETVASIWMEVLGIEKVGTADNFFDLGGHSLQLIRTHALLEDRLKPGLSVVDLFRYPTISALTHRIEHGDPATHGAADAQSTADDATRRRDALLRRKHLAEGIS